jgi:predicted RNase H-like nuclease
MLAHLPQMNPALTPRLPQVPATGNLKPVEDRIDAVLCAFIAAHWWHWTIERNILYGDQESGYIVVPLSTALSARS